jgi:hypothetical protein
MIEEDKSTQRAEPESTSEQPPHSKIERQQKFTQNIHCLVVVVKSISSQQQQPRLQYSHQKSYPSDCWHDLCEGAEANEVQNMVPHQGNVQKH